VARPLVLGEDPGLLDPLSSPSGLWLTVLWLLAAVGWAVWRAGSGKGIWHGSGVELGLLGVAVCAFLSTAGAAAYKHPAWLSSWEWLTFVVAFCLVRQLARTADDQRGLLAAALASAVSLSAHAVYQSAVELPQLRASYEDPAQLREALAKQNIHLQTDDPQLTHWAKRIQANNVFATYAHPNAFASYLVLFLPAALGWSLVSRHRFASSPRTLLALGCALLVGTALWLTHSRGAVLATLLVGTGVALGWWYRVLWKHRLWLLAVSTVFVAACFLMVRGGWISAGTGKSPQSMSYRLDYWAATWQMILDHPWLGVGLGNFGRYYPLYMRPTAFEKISDPHNFLLEIWATCGVFAVLAFLVALAAFFWITVKTGVDGSTAAGMPTTPSPPTPLNPSLRLEFYLGGMAGLLLGFLLRSVGMSADEILSEGLLAGGRSVLWFAVFALLDGIRWQGGSLVVALSAGVAAALLNCAVSGGISFPSVAQPLWVMAALSLNARETLQPSPSEGRHWFAGLWTKETRGWPGLVLPLPVLAGLWLAYVLLIFAPASSSASALDNARRHYADYYLLRREAEDALEKGESPTKQREAVSRANLYLKQYILRPLEQARQANLSDTAPLLELATWQGEQAKLTPYGEDFVRKALESAAQAQRLDPQGREGYLAEYRLHRMLAEMVKTRAKQEYGLAARAMEAVVQRDPTEARLRYLLAEALFLADDPVKGRQQAQEARQCDQRAVDLTRSLTPAQREQVRNWLEGGP
jgi:hypothetical protein